MSPSTCSHTQLTKRKVADYSTDELGIPLRLIDAVEEHICDECGALVNVTVERMSDLIAAAAIARAMDPLKLSGRDIRFFRKAMKWSARELGEVLDSTPETVSRWENDRLPMSSNSEKLLRLLICTACGSRTPGITYALDDLLQMRIEAVHNVKQEEPPLCLQRVLCVTPANRVPTATYIRQLSGPASCSNAHADRSAQRPPLTDASASAAQPERHSIHGFSETHRK